VCVSVCWVSSYKSLVEFSVLCVWLFVCVCGRSPTTLGAVAAAATVVAAAAAADGLVLFREIDMDYG
jgi:hypothetical protein